ncbi:MAG: hypothetical protein NTV89_12580, partial [Proteobacteria bacterium]|nr:hypothetical protein [Pseudomonadota bacterium]
TRMLTKSEQLFERLCETRGIAWRRIPEGETKTPDYEITISSVDVLVEVKQLDENDEDRRVNAASLRDEDTPGMECPSERIRHQIAEAYIQLKSCYRAGLATGVVLYNNAGFLNYIDGWTVTKAMFGDYGYRFGMPAPSGGAIVPLGAGFMGKRKVSRNTCRALGFVAVLKETSQYGLGLEVYHNPFAAVRLEPSRLSQLATDQFIHTNPHDSNYVRWQPTRIEV